MDLRKGLGLGGGGPTKHTASPQPIPPHPSELKNLDAAQAGEAQGPWLQVPQLEEPDP